MRRIIGFDPALRNCGWGVIEQSGSNLKHIAHGVIKPNEKMSMSERLSELHEKVCEVIKSYKPDEAAVEITFMTQNATSTLRLGMARGVILMTPSLFKIPVAEYEPNRIKKTIVGVGHADKHQMQTMVKMLLPTAKDLTSDSADALAIAITHAQYSNHRLQSA